MAVLLLLLLSLMVVMSSWTGAATMSMPESALWLCHSLGWSNLTQNLVELGQIESILLELILYALCRLVANSLILLILELFIKLLLRKTNIHVWISNGARLRFVILALLIWDLLRVTSVCGIECFHLVTEIHQDALNHIFWGLRCRSCTSSRR
jgi:hypothetical protein